MISWAKFNITPEQERRYHVVRVKASPGMNAISESVVYDMSVLDSKSAALLTFISVAIAGLIFSLGLVDGQAPDARLIRGGIFVFLALFVYAAWIDLRCLHIIGPKILSAESDGDDYESISIAELSRRRNKYSLALFLCETGFMLLGPFLMLWILVTYRVISI
ncbi:hypothetical protein [Methylocystis bryophila]|uniref:Uncharacterized protein n=1 Tax=Methylocystis bryophila TaxID=655015 RepID=A0A1W6MRY3_9HYPH|nr:hypothetical protein [Methylocystis bryophila]ARN80296.1 hypothetical protein B1812_03465 [Methylocystis bryophila]BDV40267.1 hypothetical protein DSM21852_35200 [Methylocystis bryophila]